MDCHFLLQRIFPTQGSNPGPLHCRQIPYHLSYWVKGSYRLNSQFIYYLGSSITSLFLGSYITFPKQVSVTIHLKYKLITTNYNLQLCKYSFKIRKFTRFSGKTEGHEAWNLYSLTSDSFSLQLVFYRCILGIPQTSFHNIMRNITFKINMHLIMLLLLSYSVLLDSLQPHELQHAKLPCPSPLLELAHSCPLSQWIYLNNHLILCHPLSPFALNLSQHQGLFQWAGSLHQVAKVLKLQLQH